MVDGSEQPAARRKPDLDRLRSELDAYMAKRKLRSTEQRRVIVETFFTAPEHSTIEELLAQVRKEDPRVGYATVYRTMKLLAECGVAHERKFADGFTRYELADEESHHDHIICLDCGHITEFEEPQIELLQVKVATELGFEVQTHKHELYAYCRRADCARRPAEKQRRR